MSRHRTTSPALVFAALGDETRLLLVMRLVRGGPQSISTLAAAVPVTRQAVSKHLRTLENAGVARSRRLGRERIWELRPAALTDAQRYLDQISSQWDSALARLRMLVEDDPGR